MSMPDEVMTIIGTCCACGRVIFCNPEFVPSLTVDGVKQPLCCGCFHRWNEIHRTSKGLPAVSLHPEAYLDGRE